MSWETSDKPSFNFRLYLEYLVYLVFRAIEELIYAIPRYEWSLAVGSFLVRIMFFAATDRRNVAIEGNALVFPIGGKRMDDGLYECEFCDEIPVQISGDLQNDLTVNSQRFHNVFEKWLRENPEQGFWMHRKLGRKSKRLKSGTIERDRNFQMTRSEMRAYGQRRHEGF